MVLHNNLGWTRIVLRVKKENYNKEIFPPLGVITLITIICKGQITYIPRSFLLYWETIPFFSFQKHQLTPFSCISELPVFVSQSNGRPSLQNLDEPLTWTWTSAKISRLWICLVLLWRQTYDGLVLTLSPSLFLTCTCLNRTRTQAPVWVLVQHQPYCRGTWCRYSGNEKLDCLCAESYRGQCAKHLSSPVQSSKKTKKE